MPWAHVSYSFSLSFLLPTVNTGLVAGRADRLAGTGQARSGCALGVLWLVSCQV